MGWIEAWRYCGAATWPNWLIAAVINEQVEWRAGPEPHFTLADGGEAFVGDWLVYGKRDKIQVCNDAEIQKLFDKLFEPVAG